MSALDHRALLYLGKPVEFATTDTIFTVPANKQTEDYITGLTPGPPSSLREHTLSAHLFSSALRIRINRRSQ